jgi:hypothetical protein
MSAASTLTVTGTAANTPYTVTLGSTNVTGSNSFAVSNNGSGAGVVNLGGLNDSGVPASLQFSGTGTFNLVAAGNLSSASTVTIAAGATLVVKSDTALGTNGIAITNSGNLIVDANQAIAQISGNGSLVIGNGATANTLQLVPSSAVSSVPSLTINSMASLDITNNSLVTARALIRLPPSANTSPAATTAARGTAPALTVRTQTPALLTPSVTPMEPMAWSRTSDRSRS